MELSLERGGNGVLVSEEERELVVLGGLVLAGHVLAQETECALVEGEVVVEARLHVLQRIEQREEVQQLGEVEQEAL